MSNIGYRNLLYELEKEIRSDPEIELDRLKFICGDRIPEERLGVIRDVFTWFMELENNANLGIDNLELLKEVLLVLKKHSCLEKVVAFEADRQRATLAVQLPRSCVEGSGQALDAAREGEGNLVVATPGQPGVVLEQRDGGMNLKLKLTLKFI